MEFRAGLLVQMLEQRGIRVNWVPPEERRDAGTLVAAVVVSIVANGAYDTIKAVVAEFRQRFPKSKVEIDAEDTAEQSGTEEQSS